MREIELVVKKWTGFIGQSRNKVGLGGLEPPTHGLGNFGCTQLARQADLHPCKGSARSIKSSCVISSLPFSGLR